MGFFRQQEIKLALRYLQWQYEKQKLPLPRADQLSNQARRIVDEAHQIAKARGQNVITIIKELVNEVKQK